MMRVQRACVAAWRLRRALLLACAALCALSVRVPASLSSLHHFPAHEPQDIAHALADFSNQPDITSWWVEQDHSNYTTWQYSVAFTCGARCAGHAAVRAHDEPRAAPQHGHDARLHRVSLARKTCTSLPLVPWPQFCDELEMEALVSGSAAVGAQLAQRYSTRCSALGWLSGACAQWLRAQSDVRLVRLRAAQRTPQRAQHA